MARLGRPPKYVYYPQGGRVILDPSKLRYWRDAREMTRDELARDAGLGVRTIQKYENGSICPMQDSFRALCAALGVGPEDLLFEGSRYIPVDDDPDFEEVEGELRELSRVQGGDH